MKNPPDILVQKTTLGLSPYGEHSQAVIDDLQIGQVMTAKPRRGRTLPRNSAYWAGLNAAVKATEAWPTAKHLHDDLKRLCGYVDTYFNPLTGAQEVRVQSTAFDQMPEAEFTAYFRLAQARFISQMQFDPWERVISTTQEDKTDG